MRRKSTKRGRRGSKNVQSKAVSTFLALFRKRSTSGGTSLISRQIQAKRLPVLKRQLLLLRSIPLTLHQYQTSVVRISSRPNLRKMSVVSKSKEQQQWEEEKMEALVISTPILKVMRCHKKMSMRRMSSSKNIVNGARPMISSKILSSSKSRLGE